MQGKGLETVLRAHLTDIEQEVTRIESGEGIVAYRIIKPEAASADTPADTSDFSEPVSTPSVGSDEDIPF